LVRAKATNIFDVMGSLVSQVKKIAVTDQKVSECRMVYLYIRLNYNLKP